jgi:hypothetical protein
LKRFKSVHPANDRQPDYWAFRTPNASVQRRSAASYAAAGC